MVANLIRPIALVLIFFAGLSVLSPCQQVNASSTTEEGHGLRKRHAQGPQDGNKFEKPQTSKKKRKQAQPTTEPPFPIRPPKVSKSCWGRFLEKLYQYFGKSTPATTGLTILDLPNEILGREIFLHFDSYNDEQLKINFKKQFGRVNRRFNRISKVNWANSQSEVMLYLKKLWHEKVERTVDCTSPSLLVLQEVVFMHKMIGGFAPTIMGRLLESTISCTAITVVQKRTKSCIEFCSEFPKASKDKCLKWLQISHIVINYILPNSAKCSPLFDQEIHNLFKKLRHTPMDTNVPWHVRLMIGNVEFPSWLNVLATLSVPVDATAKVAAQKDSILKRWMEGRSVYDIESLSNWSPHWKKLFVNTSFCCAITAGFARGWLNSAIVSQCLRYVNIESPWLSALVWGGSTFTTSVLESDAFVRAPLFLDIPTEPGSRLSHLRGFRIIPLSVANAFFYMTVMSTAFSPNAATDLLFFMFMTFAYSYFETLIERIAI